MFFNCNNLRNAPKVVNYERELKKLKDQIAATSDKEEKSKLIKRLSEVEGDEKKWIYLEKCHEAWAGRVAVPNAYSNRGTTIGDTANRGICIRFPVFLCAYQDSCPERMQQEQQKR